MRNRALVIVLDSAGVGHAPDAAAYGDAGADTFGHILEKCPDLRLPNLDAIGLQTARDLAAGCEAGLPSRGAAGAMTERSAGKDTTTGHWEIAGIVLEKPFPVFDAFPPEMVAAIEAEAGCTFLGNHAASGTAILDELGEEHVRTGHPILYTSADSVLQIAAHEDVLPLTRLYEICEIARKHAGGIGRVIARPFVGSPGAWRRTAGRHDYSLVPPRMVLNELTDARIPVTGIGKISDIFAGSGITRSSPTKSNADGMEKITALWAERKAGLLFANLVDFDMLFGHRRDVEGYAAALAAFDGWLGEFLKTIESDDLFIITADHGNDPTWHGTDHTRERVPVLIPSAPKPEILGLLNGYNFVANCLRDYFAIARSAGSSSG